MSYYALKGFGGIDFNASQVCSLWQAGGSSANTAASKIQAALNEIGYGPLGVDGQFGGGSLAAWKRFADANGVASNWPDCTGITKLGEQVQSGGDQGGGGVQEYHEVGGKFVPGKAPGKGMSTGMIVGLGAIALLAIGGAVLVAKKRRAGGAPIVSSKTIPAASGLTLRSAG